MKLLLEKWNRFINEGTSSYDFVVNKILNYLKDYDDYYYRVIELLDYRRPQSESILRKYRNAKRYQKAAREIEEKLFKFLEGRKVKLKMNHPKLDWVQKQDGITGTTEEVETFNRNYPVINIDWEFRKDFDEHHAAMNYLYPLGRVKSFREYEFLGSGKYEITLEEPITFKEIEELLK